MRLKAIGEHFDRRLTRGGRAWGYLFSKWCWDKIGEYFVVTFLCIIMSPVLLINYTIGSIAEWRDNRRDGVRSVRP
jgi:hypothetical protein